MSDTKFCPRCDSDIRPCVVEVFVLAESENRSGKILHREAVPAHYVDVPNCPDCGAWNLYQSRDEYLDLLTVKERRSYSKTEVEV